MKITTNMQYRKLGRTGIRVSAIGLGARAIGGDSYGETEDKWSKVMISRAFGAGATFISTADSFGRGHSETLVGKLTNCRADIIIATTGGTNFYTDDTALQKDFSADYLRHALNQSRQRLRKESIPVYLLDAPSVEILLDGTVFDTLTQFQSEGLIQHFGVSVNSPAEGFAALADERVSVLALPFNLLTRDAERIRLLDLAQEKNTGIIVTEPLANGILTQKFKGDETFPSDDIRTKIPSSQFTAMVAATRDFDFLTQANRTPTQAAIQFSLSHPAVSTVVVGCKTKEQAQENFAAIDRPPLSSTEIARIESLIHNFSTI